MTKAELEKELERRGNIILNLQNKIATYEKELEAVQILKDELHLKLSDACQPQTNNERGAGRKPLPNNIVKYILNLHSKGLSIRSIAEAAGVSVGAVHKIIKNVH